MSKMKVEIQTYKNKQSPVDQEICDLIASTIDTELTRPKIKSGMPIMLNPLNPPKSRFRQKS